jgi:putative ABC transport system permease protein
VVVDAAAYERLLAASGLPDAPALARLGAGSSGDRVPALLLGGDPGLRLDLVVRWDDVPVALAVVGDAPQVEASIDPVVVVDAAAFAESGAVADPDTVWAAGPGSAAAVRAVAGKSVAGKMGEVELLADVVAARRRAPLASGLVHLAVAAAALLLLLTVLGLALAAALEAPARAESLGRLRSLGLAHGELRRVLAGELLTPVVVGSVAGLLLGIGCALTTLGHLSLERVTGQTTTPELVVPWWTVLTVAVLVVAVLVRTLLESSRLRRTALADLLRGGDRR